MKVVNFSGNFIIGGLFKGLLVHIVHVLSIKSKTPINKKLKQIIRLKFILTYLTFSEVINVAKLKYYKNSS